MNKIANVTSFVLKQQLKVFYKMGGMACDVQYLLTAKPATVNTGSSVKRSYSVDWDKKSEIMFGDGPKDPHPEPSKVMIEDEDGKLKMVKSSDNENKSEKEKAGENWDEVGEKRDSSGETEASDKLDAWRDPITTKIHIANAPGVQNVNNI